MAVVCNDSLMLASTVPKKTDVKPPKPNHLPAKILFKSLRKSGDKETSPLRKTFLGLSTHTRRKKSPHDLISAHSFTYTRVLGEGAFGKVFMAQMKHSNAIRALKVVSKFNPRSVASQYKDLVTEQKILRKVTGNIHCIELEASWHSSINFYFLTVNIFLLYLFVANPLLTRYLQASLSL